MGLGFSESLPDVYPGGSVIYEGLQILKYLGFKRVVMVGVDMNFQVHKTAQRIVKGKGIDIESKFDDDPNHFDPRYFGKGRKYHQPESYVIENILKFLNYAAAKSTDDSFQIINAGYDSKVDFFPRVDFLRILEELEQNPMELFENLFKSKSGISITEFENSYSFLRNKEELSDRTNFDSFYTEAEVGVEILKGVITEFLPLGPYMGKYYFIERNKN